MASALKIKVICRLRPPLSHEYSEDKIVSINPHSATVSLACPTKGTVHSFPFSGCYDAHSTNEDVYDGEVREFTTTSIWNGLNATVFAYGVSGSGKTHTCSGSEADPGLVPRTLADLFKVVAKNRRNSNKTVELRMSFLELWRDQCRDLLVARDKGEKVEDLPIREGANGQIFVSGLTEAPISTYHHFDDLYTAASARRSTASTKLNDTSSRSHAILTIIVRTEDKSKNTLVEGKLKLIDLAGSENNKRTGNEHNSDRMKESTEINKSLHALRNVVAALNKGDSRIPYRDSKLTRILSDVLGGNAAGLVICNVAPGAAYYQDTLNTLTFAGLSRNVENRPVVNERDTRPVPAPHFAAAQPARAQRAVQAATGLTASSLRASSTHAAAPSASTSAARVSATGRTASRVDAVAAAPLVSAAFIEERLAKSLEATDRKIAMLETKLRDEMSKNGGDVDMEETGVVRKGSKGKGKKRERETDGDDDEEKAEMRKRLEALEKIVAGIQTKPAAPNLSTKPSKQALHVQAEDDRMKLQRAYLEKAQGLERLADRNSLLDALVLFRKALAIRPSASLRAHIEVLQDALNRHVLPAYVMKERGATLAGGAGKARPVKPLEDADLNVLRAMPAAPVKPTWTEGKMTYSAVRKPLLVGAGKMLETPAPPKPTDKAKEKEKVHDSGVAVDTPLAETGAELSDQDRARLQSLLVALFNSMDVKAIKKLKGVGATRAKAIVDFVDEEGELEAYEGAGLSKRALEKILQDNICLLTA